MVTVELKNGYIMVREIVRTEEEQAIGSGFILPKEVLEDEQVSQGTVVESFSEGYGKGDVVFFHKVTPVDISMKYGEDKRNQTYWFIKQEDVICKIKE